jgi:2-iminobutanoate/2-iminopropanoate deaminase
VTAKDVVITERAPQAIGPYSQAISWGTMVFVSGQIPLAADGTPESGGVKEQTERCLQNLIAILTAAGLTARNVVKTTVFMTDLEKFAEMNEVYARHFEVPFPARATVQVAALPKGALVEIEAVAVRL